MGMFLGLDLSTQGLTAIVINPEHGMVMQHAVSFDSDYPAYHTEGGVIREKDVRIVHADPCMWMEALDDMLAFLKKNYLSDKIRGIAVSAQQHGTVYLKTDAEKIMAGIDSRRSLCAQLKNIFSRSTSPIWMDSSTENECREITEILGGDLRAATLTGSIVTERFAGPQIRKFRKESPGSYRRTGHITLISAFITSLLTGHYVPVDAGDGFGMNLADIRSGKWSISALEATAPELETRLPEIRIRDDIVGRVSRFLVERYHFHPDTRVIIGSGDNPCSLAGLGLIGVSDIHAVSLGTSDTCFGYLPRIPDQDRTTGHLFGTADGKYMFLICFKNGSLARERIRNAFHLSWKAFSDILLHSPPGNCGRILLPYFLPEITPRILNPGIHLFGGLAWNDSPAMVRAIAEAQVMAIYLHSQWVEKKPKEIWVTGGGSENHGFLNVLSQVFAVPVRSFEVKDSAALGAAFRAAKCCYDSNGLPADWPDLFNRIFRRDSAEMIYPAPDALPVYHGNEGLVQLYQACEKYVLGKGGSPEKKIEAFKKRFFL